MPRMRRRFRFAFLLVLSLASDCSLASARRKRRMARFEFVVRATPSGGLEEPVRGFPFSC